MNRLRFSRKMLRLGTSLGLVLFLAGCASAPRSSSSQEIAEAGADDQAHRMLRYCRELHEQGDHYVATGVCKKAFELDQTNPEALHHLAQIMSEAGSPDKAAEAYFMALHLDPDDVEARYGLSKAYIAVGRHDLAIPHLTAALELQDDDYRLHNAMGVSLDQQGRHAEAQEYYHKGLAEKPTNPALHNNLNISIAMADGKASGTQLSAAPAIDPTREAVPAPSEDPLASSAVSQGGILELKTTVPVEPVMAEPVMAEPVVEQIVEAPQVVPEPQYQYEPEPEPQYEPEPVAESVEPGPNEIESTVIAQPVPEPEIAEPDVPYVPDVIESGQSLGQASNGLQPEQDPALSELDQSAAARISDALPWVAENDPASEPAMTETTESPQVAMVSPEEVHEEPEAQIEPTQEIATTAPALEISSDGPVYMLQIGSYLEQDSALDGWQVITEGAADVLTGYEPRILRADAGEDKGIVYRLRTGPVTDRAAGAALCTALSDRGFGCFVVQMTPEELAETTQPSELDIRG